MFDKHKALVQIAFLLDSKFDNHHKNHVPITYIKYVG